MSFSLVLVEKLKFLIKYERAKVKIVNKLNKQTTKFMVITNRLYLFISSSHIGWSIHYTVNSQTVSELHWCLLQWFVCLFILCKLLFTNWTLILQDREFVHGVKHSNKTRWFGINDQLIPRQPIEVGGNEHEFRLNCCLFKKLINWDRAWLVTKIVQWYNVDKRCSSDIIRASCDIPLIII